MMLRVRKSLFVVLVGAIASLMGGAAEGAAFNVYYRANANSPWVFYAGKGTSDAANATVTDLQATGYAAQVVAGNAGPAVDDVVASSNVVNGTYSTGNPYGSVASSSYTNTWGGGSPGYSYGGGYAYGAGGFRNADNWHHHDYSHDHSRDGHHEDHRDAHAANRHPTQHPHQRSAAHQGAHGGEHHGAHSGSHHASHQASHHGSHHGHSHSHSHSHSHGHHGKK